MDSRLVFRPRPHVLKPQGTPRGKSGVPTGQGAFPGCGPSCEGREKARGGAATSVKATGLGLSGPEKPVGERDGRPYRKPTLVGRCERTEVGERTFVKELGNLAP